MNIKIAKFTNDEIEWATRQFVDQFELMIEEHAEPACDTDEEFDELKIKYLGQLCEKIAKNLASTC